MVRRTRFVSGVLLALLLTLSTGCVERLLRVRSKPTEARVFVNSKPVGETDLDHPFSSYGTVSVVLRRTGYVSRRVIVHLEPPWYQYFPLDFFAEFLVPVRLEDHHVVEVELEKLPERVDEKTQEELDRRTRPAPPRRGEANGNTDSTP